MDPYPKDPFLPGNENIEVWRYVAFHKLLWAIKQKKLWLTLLNVFHQRDPFEASVPLATKDADVRISSGSGWLAEIFDAWGDEEEAAPLMSPPQGPDFLARVSKRRRALLRAAHASCWRSGDESEAMWRLYCPGHDGVAMRTTFAKLRDSVHDPHTLVSKVEYINYKTEPFKQHVYPYHPALHKRKAFQHEQEVRVLRFRPEDFDQAGQDEKFSAEDHIEIDWDPEDVIDRILVGPQCPVEYVGLFQDTVARFSPTLAALVVRSELLEEPSY